MIYFLDNSNCLMMGAFRSPISTVLTRDEYMALRDVVPADRPAALAELRAPKPEAAAAPEAVPEAVNG